MPRRAQVKRITSETDVLVEIDLDGTGVHDVSTGIAFFDHMISQIARHGMVDIKVRASGDLCVDAHHTVEDVGIVLGRALRQALAGGLGIRRYGYFLLPMDEALAQCAMDFSGRPYLVFRAQFSADRVGCFETQLVEEFFRGLTSNAGLTLHLALTYGTNTHHEVEALFKAFGRALDQAKQLVPRLEGAAASTKGRLEL